MDIVGVKTTIGGRDLSVNLPDKKSIIIRGRNSEYFITIFESLLANDYTNNVYKREEGVSKVIFREGALVGKDKSVFMEGKIPKIHCIRYLDSGRFRSFLISDEVSYSELYSDMKKYSGIIPEAKWIRLCEIVNSIVGFNLVYVVDKKIKFCFSDVSEFSIEAQKLVYLLVAECFITPKGYRRILILPDIDLLNGRQQALLIEHLDNIIGHDLCISSGNISVNDLSRDSVLSFLNI